MNTASRQRVSTVGARQRDDERSESAEASK